MILAREVRVRRLVQDARGATLVEFALVAPIMMLVIMSLCDLCYREYAQSILTGAVQRSARDAALEGGSLALDQLDARVVAAVHQISKGATWHSDRKTYKSFTAITPEPFTDANHNDRYDGDECFSDTNGNKAWDADPSKTGQGGANDVTLYTMSITYPRMFPVGEIAGLAGDQTIKASTILKNQPYGIQAPSDPVAICP